MISSIADPKGQSCADTSGVIGGPNQLAKDPNYSGLPKEDLVHYF